MTNVLFVCLGNICRSPLAQGIFEHHISQMSLQEQFYADSAGTSGWHEGERPHSGSMSIASERGVSLEGQRSRPVVIGDRDEFHCLVAMDKSNRSSLLREFGAPEEKVVLMRRFDPNGKDKDVPDPWGSGKAAFAEVFDILDRSMPGLIEYLNHKA